MTLASMHPLTVGSVTFSNDHPFCLISVPCQLESLDHSLMLAETLAALCADLGIGYVFKASYDKANRSSLKGLRGVGMERGLDMLAEVRTACWLPSFD